MYGTSSTPKDLNLPYPSTSPFGGHRNAESDSKANLFGSHHQEQQQMNSSRLHCRPAPSSLLGELCEDFLPLRSSCPDTETCFAGFLGPDLQIGDKSSGGGGGAATSQRSHHFLLPQPRGGEEVSALRSGALPSASQMMFHSRQKKQQMPNHSSMECSYPMVGSMAMETEQIKKEGAASSSNLVRHSSSPAGLFSHLNVENGYPMLGGMAYLRNENGSMGDAEIRLKNQISFSSRQNSIMSQISEVNCGSSPEESSGGGRCYIPGFPATSWENSSLFSDNNFSGLKPGRERSELQNGDVRNHASGLTHQFSLPKTSSEMTTVEKYLQFQDAVPCKFRANRGCATHPRSIAERVRRTRISERTRKLQELVPNMDKQTNTADMLDSAVSYIKDLEEQVKTLSEKRASCTCSSGKQKQHMDPSP